MAFTGSDLFAISRAGTNYSVAGSDVLAYVSANLGTTDRTVADIPARQLLTNVSFGDNVMVLDATGDATVTAGWALYQYLGVSTWRKIAEQESLDVTFNAATNLSYTAGATQGVVTSDTGADATITAVSGANAGLMLPAHLAKSDFLTVTAATNLDTLRTRVNFIAITQPVDLDAVEAASHAAVTTAGTAATNPIVVTGQVLSFNIGALTPAP